MPADLARIDEVCDAVVERITAAWTNLNAPDAVTAVDEIDIITDAEDPERIQGRQVYVLPDAYDSPEASARGSDFNTYTVVILIARLFTRSSESETLKDFARAERYWVQETIYKPLTDVRAERLLSSDDSGGLIPIAPSMVETPFDAEELRDRKLFFSVVRVTYREDVDA